MNKHNIQILMGCVKCNADWNELYDKAYFNAFGHQPLWHLVYGGGAGGQKLVAPTQSNLDWINNHYPCKYSDEEIRLKELLK